MLTPPHPQTQFSTNSVFGYGSQPDCSGPPNTKKPFAGHGPSPLAKIEFYDQVALRDLVNQSPTPVRPSFRRVFRCLELNVATNPAAEEIMRFHFTSYGSGAFDTVLMALKRVSGRRYGKAFRLLRQYLVQSAYRTVFGQHVPKLI
ncbi:hypothetical protein HYE67_001721 [Fusarium culmorum]|uniref:Uncharacterized protein n=1 Tax=Fusarium culmorum TaxID=5516 RepID=A0A2T4GW49_FUSCU|nr:hypothetical protein FCULG_00005887 [Fusarium culmorum]QPC59490.1 hypothetical protein HYE67_001721 [Fusarium culmorum]